MSPEKQRVEIAKFLNKGLCAVTPLDLNVMHEAEKLLSIELASKYEAALMNVALYSECTSYPALSCDWHFPASQRAEALLRVLGKWENEA